jgi:hypothetical protein
MDSTQVLRHYNKFITEDYMIEKIIGTSYDKQPKQVMYIVEWLNYLDREDWTEERFEHMMTALVMFMSFINQMRTSHETLASETESVYTFIQGWLMLRFFNGILHTSGYFFFIINKFVFICCLSY